jgi:TatD DNase family protein
LITLTDTHAHLYSNEFDEDRNEMFKRAFHFGIKRFFLPNIDEESITPMLQLMSDYPNQCFGMMGLHPCSVKENVDEQLKFIEQALNANQFVAIGEIGIDLYWDKTFFEQQKKAFKTQCLWALERNLPIAIHCRNAMQEIIDLLEDLKATTGYKSTPFKGIFHCFSGNNEEANKLINYGFYLGIGGVLTYKNSGLDKAIEDIDLKHLVLETDAPYLAPVPMRGKRNESAFLRHVAEKLADIKQCSLFDVASITTQNSIQIFGV